MKTKTEMTFAPGWTQEIRTGDNEKCDLASYISDTHKSIYGYRPRFWDMREWSLEDLRAEAAQLESEVKDSIERDRQRAVQQAADDAAHHLAVAEAFKPKSVGNRPFANLKACLDAETEYYKF